MLVTMRTGSMYVNRQLWAGGNSSAGRLEAIERFPGAGGVLKSSNECSKGLIPHLLPQTVAMALKQPDASW